MHKQVISRQAEQQQLQKILESDGAEFVAVYGRRRVGKTHLVRQFFQNKGVYFEVTGLKDGALQTQLANFMLATAQSFTDIMLEKTPDNWRDALNRLTEAFSNIQKSKKIIFFIDELPWLATRKSGFMQALDYFWNTCWSQMNNFKLVVCGSAASWMLDHLVHAKGGLHNRLTKTILLQPFTLSETKEYLQQRKVKLNNKQLTDIYMVMGGVPYYLNHINPALSAVQNINDMCFSQDGILYNEFSSLFSALFDDAELSRTLIRLIASKRQGISRNSLLEQIDMQSGGRFNTKMNELIASNFVQDSVPYGKLRKNIQYRVNDLYTLFYLKWIDKVYKSNRQISDNNYWKKKVNTPSYISWAGYAFETICMNHSEVIAKALGLEHISYEVGSWWHIPKKGASEVGAQIDLLFDRADGIITLCEIKYTANQYSLTKNDARNIMNKINVFSQHFKTNKQISMALVTTMGMKKSIWSEELIDHVITLNDLL